MATNVVINNQPRQSPTVISVQSNQWSTGICDCFDDLEICMSFYMCLMFDACVFTCISMNRLKTQPVPTHTDKLIFEPGPSLRTVSRWTV